MMSNDYFKFSFSMRRLSAGMATLLIVGFMIYGTSSAKRHPLSTETMLIPKAVPADIKITIAPDEDLAHYRTLDDTHYSYRCYVPYTLITQQAAIEVCEINPVKLQIVGWPETEVIQIVAGRVKIIEANGSSKQYLAGDTFVLPQGFEGVWDQPEKLSKVVVRNPLYWKD